MEQCHEQCHEKSMPTEAKCIYTYKTIDQYVRSLFNARPSYIPFFPWHCPFKIYPYNVKNHIVIAQSALACLFSFFKPLRWLHGVVALADLWNSVFNLPIMAIRFSSRYKFLLSFLYSIHSAICRPSDPPVRRARWAEILTRLNKKMSWPFFFTIV